MAKKVATETWNAQVTDPKFTAYRKDIGKEWISLGAEAKAVWQERARGVNDARPDAQKEVLGSCPQDQENMTYRQCLRVG